ncbi:DUF4878 domain-containing protein [Xylanibacter muris]|uniref:DUF4878 domain-containing protein n=1 Tax=Xylanibacter muris TaxID=2736290 RepID=A0ABX2AK05_9BACT|nr:DUF4878 domain-containing protein [Xylanibacter muris]NPD91506.1 DUF4878 domain-containing protein [Xylanibacter muris]
MKRTFENLLSLAVLMLVMVACGASTSSPKGAFEYYAEAFVNGDYETYVSGLVNEKGEAIADKEKETLKSILKEKQEKKEEKIREMKVLNETVSEDKKTAVIDYTLIMEDGTENEGQKATMVKVGNEWKMVLGSK